MRLAGHGRNLCLAGGLGFNALLVSALENRSGFENVFVQPVAGNAGTAIGAALETWHHLFRQEKRVRLDTLSLGPSYSAAETKQVLENCKLNFHYLLTTEELIAAAVAQLNDHRIVAWMHGRMEFGARALGNRSILASPLDPYSTENLNTFIKHREPVRKFAASVPAELAGQYFEVGPNARYLATVGRVRPEYAEKFAAAILAGDLVRVHTVDARENPLYWKLPGFEKHSGLGFQHFDAQAIHRDRHLHVVFHFAELGHGLESLLHLFAQFGHIVLRQFDGM